jgi:hypothetical protein
MIGQCCRNRARRRAGFAASILPGTALVLLPKCPLCLAAWLGVVTGVGVSAAAAAYLRGAIVILCVASVALGISTVIARIVLAPRHQDRNRN